MCKIMVVDDSKIMRIHISRQIEELGHTVVAQAACSFEALEMCRVYKPDVITLDINMPKVQGVDDGIHAIKLLREINPEVKIIMVTATGDHDTIMETIHNGANGYILKPIKIDTLKRTFTKVLYHN